MPYCSPSREQPCTCTSTNEPQGARTAEKPVRVGDLVKAKEITRDQVLAAVATIFDGRATVPVADAYALILPDLAKMTSFTREAIMAAMIEAGAVKR